MNEQGGYLYAAPMDPASGWPRSYTWPTEVVLYGCAPPLVGGDPPCERIPATQYAPPSGPEPVAPGSSCNLVETVRQRLAQALAERSTLDAEIETLERMLAAAEGRR